MECIPENWTLSADRSPAILIIECILRNWTSSAHRSLIIHKSASSNSGCRTLVTDINFGRSYKIHFSVPEFDNTYE